MLLNNGLALTSRRQTQLATSKTILLPTLAHMNKNMFLLRPSGCVEDNDMVSSYMPGIAQCQRGPPKKSPNFTHRTGSFSLMRKVWDFFCIRLGSILAASFFVPLLCACLLRSAADCMSGFRTWCPKVSCTFAIRTIGQKSSQ